MDKEKQEEYKALRVHYARKRLREIDAEECLAKPIKAERYAQCAEEFRRAEEYLEANDAYLHAYLLEVLCSASFSHFQGRGEHLRHAIEYLKKIDLQHEVHLSPMVQDRYKQLQKEARELDLGEVLEYALLMQLNDRPKGSEMLGHIDRLCHMLDAYDGSIDIPLKKQVEYFREKGMHSAFECLQGALFSSPLDASISLVRYRGRELQEGPGSAVWMAKKV